MAEETLRIVGGGKERTAPLDPAGMVVGRVKTCDVALDGERVSRRHARIFRDPFGRWLIQDLGSRNGLKVDGERVDVCALIPGRRVDVGGFVLQLGGDEGEIPPDPEVSGSVTASVSDDPQTHVTRAAARPEAQLSRGRLKWLNSMADRLAGLDKPDLLYREVCRVVARSAGTAAAVLRLDEQTGLPQVLACHVGGGSEYASPQAGELPLSRRVVQAVRETRQAVMASSAEGPDSGVGLSIVDEAVPRTVYCCPVADTAGPLDALYVDVPADQAMSDTFDFYQAVAHQVILIRKSLLLARARAEQEVLEHQLETAREIQAGLTPTGLEGAPGVDVAFCYEPALWVGGDYCDVWRLDDGKLALAVGDVCGKGLSAALGMANLQAALRSTLSFCRDLGAAATHVDKLLAQNLPEGMFVTAFVGLYDPSNGELEYVNAGHILPLVIRPGDGASPLGEPTNTPLGLFPKPLRAETCTLDDHTGLLVLTDGVTEAVSPDGEWFGDQRVADLFASLEPDSAEHIVATVTAAAGEYRGNAPQQDDITVLALLRTN